VIEGLNRKPVAVPAKHPRTGEEIAVVFDGTRLAGGLVMAASQTPVIPQVPGLIHALFQGNHDGLTHIAWSAMPPPGDFAHGLSLAGELDVMTPPAWAHDTARTLSNAHVFEVPGYGHSPTFSGPCPASMALAFYADPTQAPDASCLAEMKIAFAVPGEA
jgi:pimeloyl-ACP methyl ester carboxylesterase